MLHPDALHVDIEAALGALAEQGYARIGRVMDDAALEALRARTNELMLGEVRYDGFFFQHDTSTGRYEDLLYKRGYVGPSLNYRKLEKLEKDPLFFSWIQNPLFEAIAKRAIGTEVSIYRAVLFNKSACGGSVLPWHQDGGSY